MVDRFTPAILDRRQIIRSNIQNSYYRSSFMQRTNFLILFVFVFSLVGCQEEENTAKDGNRRIDTPAGMIEHLRSARLPALKSIEVWENEYGPGLKITTAHYEIFTTLMEPLMLSQLPSFLECAYHGYQKQLPEPVNGSANKFTVYLFAERRQWDLFTVRFTGPQAATYLKIKRGAYYLNGACVAYNIGRERTFAVVGHEGWHQFNSRYFKYRLPSWLDEGIAMQFEISRYEDGLFTFESGRNLQRLSSLRMTLAGANMIPLEQLIALNPGEVIGSDDSVTAFYSQAYALVRFLREDGYGKRLGSFHQMLSDGLKGRWQLSEGQRRVAIDRRIPLTVRWNRSVGSELFHSYIGDDFKGLEEEYRRFCKKIVYHIRVKR